MTWWGKLAGGVLGFMLGGPLGALLGVALGHGLDHAMGGLPIGFEKPDPAKRARVQRAFFTATFSIMGHMAKADGRVSEREIALAESVIARMELSPDMRHRAIELFTEGKREGFPLDAVLEQLRLECRRRDLLRMFTEIQIQAAYADGRPGPNKQRLLLHICSRLGISESVFRYLERITRLRQESAADVRGNAGPTPQRPMTRKPALDRAYMVLGVESKATDAEIKRAYRRLLSQHHPDKLVSKGLPEQMLKLATEKTHEIRRAYETITQARIP